MKSSQKYKNSVFRNIYEQPYNERTRIKLYNSAKGKRIIFVFLYKFLKLRDPFLQFSWIMIEPYNYFTWAVFILEII